MKPATLLKKRLWRRCFPVNFAKLLKTLFLQDTSGRLYIPYIQNPRYSILRNLSIYLVKIQVIQIPNTFKILAQSEYRASIEHSYTQNSQLLVTLSIKTLRHIQNLSNIYNGAFCSEPCVTLEYFESWYIQNLRNIQNPVKYL